MQTKDREWLNRITSTNGSSFAIFLASVAVLETLLLGLVKAPQPTLKAGR
jgi:hypothetical protein